MIRERVLKEIDMFQRFNQILWNIPIFDYAKQASKHALPYIQIMEKYNLSLHTLIFYIRRMNNKDMNSISSEILDSINISSIKEIKSNPLHSEMVLQSYINFHNILYGSITGKHLKYIIDTGKLPDNLNNEQALVYEEFTKYIKYLNEKPKVMVMDIGVECKPSVYRNKQPYVSYIGYILYDPEDNYIWDVNYINLLPPLIHKCIVPSKEREKKEKSENVAIWLRKKWRSPGKIYIASANPNDKLKITELLKTLDNNAIMVRVNLLLLNTNININDYANHISSSLIREANTKCNNIGMPVEVKRILLNKLMRTYATLN